MTIDVDFSIDTGADVSIVAEKISNKLELNLAKPVQSLTGADGSLLDIIGVNKVNIESMYSTTDSDVYV